MPTDDSPKKITLSGFNNLTKSLSFNIYDICYAGSLTQTKQYLEYINDAYNGKRLLGILQEISELIGARVLNVSNVDYEPHGASATMLISDTPNTSLKLLETASHSSSQVLHLDKSHIAVHTYPEIAPNNGVCTFRSDIDISTCGNISPLKALDTLITRFDSDIVIIDYRVRGFTRDATGQKHFIDHKIHSVQDFIAPLILQRYQSLDVNSAAENLFHTKMRLKAFDLDNYLFDIKADNLSAQQREELTHHLQDEINDIYIGEDRPLK